MGKIRVQDLAKLMGVEGQDLIFKVPRVGNRGLRADARKA